LSGEIDRRATAGRIEGLGKKAEESNGQIPPKDCAQVAAQVVFCMGEPLGKKEASNLLESPAVRGREGAAELPASSEIWERKIEKSQSIERESGTSLGGLSLGKAVRTRVMQSPNKKPHNQKKKAVGGRFADEKRDSLSRYSFLQGKTRKGIRRNIGLDEHVKTNSHEEEKVQRSK